MIDQIQKQFEEFSEKIANSSSEADVLGLKGQVMGKRQRNYSSNEINERFKHRGEKGFRLLC